MSMHDGNCGFKGLHDHDLKQFVVEFGFDGPAMDLIYIPGGKGVKASIKFDAHNVYTCEGGPGDVS